MWLTCVRLKTLHSIFTVMELVSLGLGVGVVPLFMAKSHPNLVPLTEALEECKTELWVLTHPESRHLRRVSTVYRHLSHTLSME